MAKKKAAPKRKASPAKKAPPPDSLDTLTLVDTAELLADGANPRRISEEAARGLQNSLDRFGDLSGLVFNRRTGELVCGHQRMQQIREKWGDQRIEVLNAEAGLGGIRVDASHYFPVRIVDWSPAMQRAANVAANSQRIAGEFTDDLSQYLLDVEADLSAEAPGILDELLLVELMAEGIDTTDAVPKNVDFPEKRQVVVDCESEEQQAEVHELLMKGGWKCRVLTL